MDSFIYAFAHATPVKDFFCDDGTEYLMISGQETFGMPSIQPLL
jgi:hypothetical protein